MRTRSTRPVPAPVPRARATACAAVVAAVLAALTALPGTTAAAHTAGAHARTRHEGTYAYGPGPRHRLDAYWYDTAARRPALLILHGGYGDSGDKAAWAGTARYFARHGFTVFSADYRWGTDVAWPGPRDDALAALGWIRTHAARFNTDPAHVSVLGSQAGGHLAAALATYGAGRALVDAAVGLSPILSPYRAWVQASPTSDSAIRRRIRDDAVILHRCHPDPADPRCWARWADSVVKFHASGPGDAPMYLIHATADPIPAAHSTDLRDAEVARGAGPATVTVQTVRGSGSGGLLLTTAVRARILDWLRARARIARPLPPGMPLMFETAPAPPTAPGGTAPAPAEDDPVPAAPSESTLRIGDVPLVTGTYAYGPDPAQRLDAFHVPGRRRPALVIIHGGYWYEEDKSSWATLAQWYARHGYAVFPINYRLDGRSGWTAQRADALAAIAWIRAHADRFGVDPARVLLLGSSAGGQIATAVGTYGRGISHVRGVVALSPVASPYRAYTDGQRPDAGISAQKLRDNATLLARCHPAGADLACWRRWSDSVVKNHAGRGDAPMYLLHSRGDFVSPAHSADLCTALAAAHVGCTLTVVDGYGHASAILRAGGVHARILAWLRAHE